MFTWSVLVRIAAVALLVLGLGSLAGSAVSAPPVGHPAMEAGAGWVALAVRLGNDPVAMNVAAAREAGTFALGVAVFNASDDLRISQTYIHSSPRQDVRVEAHSLRVTRDAENLPLAASRTMTYTPPSPGVYKLVFFVIGDVAQWSWSLSGAGEVDVVATERGTGAVLLMPEDFEGGVHVAAHIAPSPAEAAVATTAAFDIEHSFFGKCGSTPLPPRAEHIVVRGEAESWTCPQYWSPDGNPASLGPGRYVVERTSVAPETLYQPVLFGIDLRLPRA